MQPPAASYAEACKQNEVDYPAIVPGDGIDLYAGQALASTKEANGRIAAGNACIDAVVTMGGKAPSGEK